LQVLYENCEDTKGVIRSRKSKKDSEANFQSVFNSYWKRVQSIELMQFLMIKGINDGDNMHPEAMT